MCVLKQDFGILVVSTIYFIPTSWDTSFWIELSKLISLKSELYGKKGRNMPKNSFFVKNVCFETN